MYKATTFMVLMASAMVLFTVSAYAVQENNTTSNEKISVLNNATVNNTDTNNTGTNFMAINNTIAIGANVSQNVTAKNNTSMNNAAPNEINATAQENYTSVEQSNTRTKELGMIGESKSRYDIEKYSTIKPMYNVSAYSNIKRPFNVGGNSESRTFGIGATAKPGIDISKNTCAEHTFDLSLPEKPIIETSKFPFMCNIV
jgi:hypothetical protein